MEAISNSHCRSLSKGKNGQLKRGFNIYFKVGFGDHSGGLPKHLVSGGEFSKKTNDWSSSYTRAKETFSHGHLTEKRNGEEGILLLRKLIEEKGGNWQRAMRVPNG